MKLHVVERDVDEEKREVEERREREEEEKRGGSEWIEISEIEREKKWKMRGGGRSW